MHAALQFVQMLSDSFLGSVFPACLLLPARPWGLWQLALAAAWWASKQLTDALMSARYGLRGSSHAAGVPAHAPLRLSWPAAWEQLRASPLHLPGLAACWLLPLAASWLYARLAEPEGRSRADSGGIVVASPQPATAAGSSIRPPWLQAKQHHQQQKQQEEQHAVPADVALPAAAAAAPPPLPHAVPAAAAAEASASAGQQLLAPILYASSHQHCLLQAKFSVAPGSPLSAATAVAMVVHAAQAAAGQMHVYASSVYPGCLEVILLAAGADVPVSADNEAVFAAALMQQLREMAPASQLLLSAERLLVGGVQPVLHPGVWCEPALAAGSGSQALTIRLPLQLVQSLAAEGRALRVVATVDHQQGSATDTVLQPGDASWPGSGQLHVSVRLASERQLLMVHLLSQQQQVRGARQAASRAGGGSAGGSHLLSRHVATLPVLLVPAAVCAEMQQLFRSMQQEVAAGGQLPGGGQDSSAAAALAYQRHMSVFVLDCTVLLRQGPSACQPVAHAVLHLLASQGMAAATQLLRDAGVMLSGQQGAPPAGGPAEPDKPDEPAPAEACPATQHAPGSASSAPAGSARARCRGKAHRAPATRPGAADASAAGDQRLSLLHHALLPALCGFRPASLERAYQQHRQASAHRCTAAATLCTNGLLACHLLLAACCLAGSFPAAAVQLLTSRVTCLLLLAVPAGHWGLRRRPLGRWRGLLRAAACAVHAAALAELRHPQTTWCGSGQAAGGRLAGPGHPTPLLTLLMMYAMLQPALLQLGLGWQLLCTAASLWRLWAGACWPAVGAAGQVHVGWHAVLALASVGMAFVLDVSRRRRWLQLLRACEGP